MSKFKRFLKKLKNRGQTAVEYILLLFVMVVIVSSILKQVKEYIMAGSDNCTETSSSLVCRLSMGYDIGRINGYQYYTLRQ